MEEGKTIFPEGFNMQFPFTNRSDEDFSARWGKKEYTFAAMSTTPMLGMIHDATPLELQGIRKKFAKEWAEQQFFRTDKYRVMLSRERNSDGTAKLNSFQSSAQYSETDLAELIQMCLTPLPIAEAQIKEVREVPLEDRLNRDEDGELITRAVKDRQPLHKKTLKTE